MQHKAEKGELRFRLAPGYEFDDQGCIVKTNDEQVAQFIDLLFSKLFEFGSISGLTKFLLHGDFKSRVESAAEAASDGSRPTTELSSL